MNVDASYKWSVLVVACGLLFAHLEFVVRDMLFPMGTNKDVELILFLIEWIGVRSEIKIQ